jgi:uncharacterized delta-60 repeat protein
MGRSPTGDGGLFAEANWRVRALAVQGDGRVLVGGGFSLLGGQSRKRLGRLSEDGIVDMAFDPGVDGSSVYALAVDDAGRIVVAGDFIAVGGQTRNHLARLSADGALDPAFNPGADDSVTAVALERNGALVVGGEFTRLGGEARSRIARLEPDGTVDAGFDPGADSSVYALALQPDGKWLVGGAFSILGGQPRGNLGRLNPDGTVDPTFNPGADDDVHVFVVQSDGRILVGGEFTALGGQPRGGLGRLNPDGTLDALFDPGADSTTYSIALQSDGGILVGGWMSTLGGAVRSHLGRLNPNGTLDPGFEVGADATVLSLALQADGRILVGGEFSNLGGQPRGYLGRLDNTGPAIASLLHAGDTLTWVRGGTAPETSGAEFEVSADGVHWTALGPGQRVAGGWALSGVAVPEGSSLRVRGRATGGRYNSSSWITESYAGPPVFLRSPANRTNDATTTATFGVVVGSAGPYSCRWYKDGLPLVDGGNVVGASTTTLAVANVFAVDAGAYSVVVTNSSGSRSSAEAALRVREPLISGQPTGQNRELGEAVELGVTGIGTPPLEYHWYRDGMAIEGAREPTLALSNLQGRDAGRYSVVVSNAHGTATSLPAALTVNTALLDSEFAPSAGSVSAMIVQSDGRVITSNLQRFGTDGTLDPGFKPGADSSVLALAVQEDGGVLVGGSLSRIGGHPRSGLARLTSDGAVDAAFDPGATFYSFKPSVLTLAVQMDGKVLVGGAFVTLGGVGRAFLGRVDPNGSVDPGFDPGANYYVQSLVVQSDGRILVAGGFTMLGGQPRTYLGRLNSDGTLDPTFHPEIVPSEYPGGVTEVALQADGKIVFGGRFNRVSGETRLHIARLNSDGTLDTGFDPGAEWDVHSLLAQADGDILVGGNLTILGGEARSHLGRLNADGTVDLNFNPGAGGSVMSLGLQSDGRVLVGGGFVTLAGAARGGFGRLVNTGPARESLEFREATVTWLRGGTGPEVSYARFEHSPDGVTWTSLGAGIRVEGGWRLTGVEVPEGGTLRARGRVVAGRSTWLTEAYSGAPAWTRHPASRTNDAGTTATFSVAVQGDAPVAFRWRKNGVDLTEGGNVTGATSSELRLISVFAADEGVYSVVVSNGVGSHISSGAVLRVRDPFIRAAPASQNRGGGGKRHVRRHRRGIADPRIPLVSRWLGDRE